ncbi:M81 family metallopeptidase [Gymnodinialimonas sp.]
MSAPKRPRIAVAGFQHETNSFSPTPATLADFEMDDSWPGLSRGPDVIHRTRGINLPIAGFVQAAEADPSVEIIPILWASAEPSGPVTDAAFDTIAGWILDGLKAAGPLDGLYLDLHGAMITERHDDGEGALLTLLRAALGPDLPITISLDLHANISATMVAHATSIALFRTYPHLDMADTGARCLPMLKAQIQGARPCKAFAQVPYLIPLHAQCTDMAPMGPLYALAEAAGAELAAGFTGGDTRHTCPSILAYADTQAAADQAVATVLDATITAEPDFIGTPPPPDQVVRAAMALPEDAPVIIADVEDNPGGGGSSDTTGLLRALVEGGAQGALLGVMHDPDVAQAAHRAGLGATIAMPLGGRSGCAGDRPYEACFQVDALSDGRVVYEGAMYGGGEAQIGPSALLKVMETNADVRIVVSSVRNQCLDRGYFRALGVDPETARIVAIKSTVHFREAFAPMAQAVLTTRVPGALSSDLTQAPFKHLRDGVRLGPMGPVFRRA